MKNITNRIAGIATLALAVLPMAALTTAAHAAPARVEISDLNLATPAGAARLDHRVAVVTKQFCGGERSIAVQKACRAGVRAEISEKLASVAPMTVLASR